VDEASTLTNGNVRSIRTVLTECIRGTFEFPPRHGLAIETYNSGNSTHENVHLHGDFAELCEPREARDSRIQDRRRLAELNPGMGN
jgi:hypothetical protein